MSLNSKAPDMNILESDDETDDDTYDDVERAEDYMGYEFTGLYSECITNNTEHLNSIFVKYNLTRNTVVLTHEIFFNTMKYKAGVNPYDVTLYYFVKIPKKGLTYFELFKQIDKQFKPYFKKYWNLKKNICDDHTFIEGIRKVDAVTYDIECGS
mgnify:CR=1 FL=1